MKKEMVKDDIVAPLLVWYDANKRILPWRENREPYRIWVSEIMLQQTRVEAVKPYFDRFITQLPGVDALAAAQEERLLKLWEGLGYYNRVKNMQKAAKIVMDEYNGKMPASYDLLLALPGIGSYTAGAIASIAFGQPVPAVDGNVLRILTRLCADPSDVLNPRFKKETEEKLLAVMPAERAGDFNQAMMELGATVCLPNGMPKCGACPWRELCEARKQNKISEIPFKAKKKPRSVEQKTVLLLRDGDRTLIRKRGRQGLLAGMYEFPMFDGWLSQEEISERVAQLGFQALYVKQLEDAVHIFTHKEWHMKGYLIKVAESGFSEQSIKERDTSAEIKEPQTNSQGEGKAVQTEKSSAMQTGSLAEPQTVQTGSQADCDDPAWYKLILPEEIESRYPVPSAFRAYTKYVDITLGNEVFLR